MIIEILKLMFAVKDAIFFGLFGVNLGKRGRVVWGEVVFFFDLEG